MIALYNTIIDVVIYLAYINNNLKVFSGENICTAVMILQVNSATGSLRLLALHLFLYFCWTKLGPQSFGPHYSIVKKKASPLTHRANNVYYVSEGIAYVLFFIGATTLIHTTVSICSIFWSAWFGMLSFCYHIASHSLTGDHKIHQHDPLFAFSLCSACMQLEHVYNKCMCLKHISYVICTLLSGPDL